MNIYHLGKLIEPNDYFDYINEAEQLETIKHNYGNNTVIPNKPCWMEYRNQGTEIGSIAFTRHTCKHPVLIEMVLKIKNILENVFPKSIPVMVERIHFLKTSGNIPIHKDESGRYSCINIGVKNSSAAVTKLSNDGVFKNFKANSQSINLLDGHGYLVNTNQWHSVESPIEIQRYLITYGFGEKFDFLYNKFRNKDEQRLH